MGLRESSMQKAAPRRARASTHAGLLHLLVPTEDSIIPDWESEVRLSVRSKLQVWLSCLQIKTDMESKQRIPIKVSSEELHGGTAQALLCTGVPFLPLTRTHLARDVQLSNPAFDVPFFAASWRYDKERQTGAYHVLITPLPDSRGQDGTASGGRPARFCFVLAKCSGRGAMHWPCQGKSTEDLQMCHLLCQVTAPSEMLPERSQKTLKITSSPAEKSRSEADLDVQFPQVYKRFLPPFKALDKSFGMLARSC